MDTTTVAYNQGFTYRNKPRSSYEFPDFLLLYLGYLPQGEAPKGRVQPSGDHIFRVIAGWGTDNVESQLFSWSTGFGELSPVELEIQGKFYTFYPWNQAKVVEGKEKDQPREG